MSHPTPLRASAHHAYKSWSSTWYDDQGHRRTKRFGKVGEISRKVARLRFQNWLRNEWEAKGYVRNPSDPDSYTVPMLVEAYREYARSIYRRNGVPSTHLWQVNAALDAFLAMYRQGVADEIGAPEITKLRDAMIVGADRHGVVRARSIHTVNGRLQIIKQMYKWARSYGLVSKETAYDVSLVLRLKDGRSKAKSPKKITPVPEDVLAATLAIATPTIRDMIGTMILTAMRPGELCGMRVCDIERVGDVWLYRPTTHKSQQHGKDRVIPLGPQAQAILLPYIKRRPGIADYVFLPVETHAERLEQIGFPKIKAYQTSRSVFKPGRRFTTDSFHCHVYRTCDRAFDPDGKLLASRSYAHRWHPHRLRHNAATRLRALFGSEAAQNVLGHSQISTTMIYAERSLESIKQIAATAG